MVAAQPITAKYFSWPYDCKAPFTRHNLLSNRFDNPVNVCIHDTTGCQTRCQTDLTTGCIVYTNIQPVVEPVWQSVWQTAVSCIQPVVKSVVQPSLTTVLN